MTQLEVNRKIIQHLTELIEKMPGQRWQQLMVNVGMVEGPSDQYYDKGEITLARIEEARRVLGL